MAVVDDIFEDVVTDGMQGAFLSVACRLLIALTVFVAAL